jgi:mycothiol synthase
MTTPARETTNTDMNLTIRPCTKADMQTIVDLINLCAVQLEGYEKPITDLEELEEEYSLDQFDIERDTRGAFTSDGQLVGFMEVMDIREPHTEYGVFLKVHPDYWETDLKDTLMNWGEERARENIVKAPEGARAVAVTWANTRNPRPGAYYSSRGYQKVRSFYRMRIDFENEPQAAVFPPNITIKTYVPGENDRDVWFGHQESFKDHYGSYPQPFEAWTEWVSKDTTKDPALWFIAYDGDQVAGVCLNYPKLNTAEEDTGYVSVLGVLRPWRKIGLGSALLQHAFSEIYKRGKKAVALGVDASSLTGAIRLYERAGMRVVLQHDKYEKVLRDGVDLITKEVSG